MHPKMCSTVGNSLTKRSSKYEVRVSTINGAIAAKSCIYIHLKNILRSGHKTNYIPSGPSKLSLVSTFVLLIYTQPSRVSVLRCKTVYLAILTALRLYSNSEVTSSNINKNLFYIDSKHSCKYWHS